MENLKIALLIRKQLTFVLRTGKVILPPKGPVEPQPGCQPRSAVPVLIPLQHNSIIPRSHKTGWILAGIALPGPGSWTLQLSKGRGIIEKWISADD